jgi:hypothetical protein
MIKATDVYNDAKDQLNEEENGQFSYAMFNRLSWLAHLRLMDWLSGDVAATQPPEPFLTSKNKDWLSPFVVSVKASPTNGEWPLPSDFYRMHNFEIIGSYTEQDCETKQVIKVVNPNTPGEVVQGNEFASRGVSYIDELRGIPMAKIVSNKLMFLPSDPGSIVVEYLR